MPPAGILLVDKPSGWTSHDAVMVMRRRLGVRRIGHTGTLDPMATGLLVLLVGDAAKMQASFQQAAKIYEGVIRFGSETDTWDAEGKVLYEKPLPPIAREAIDAAVSGLTGKIIQPVPVYSAVKYRGVPMHRLARRGDAPATAVLKEVEIYSWRGVEWSAPELRFSVECSSGTYVRSLAHMLGEKFGCGAHLKALRRIKVGEFDIAGALPADTAKTMPSEEIAARLLPAAGFIGKAEA